MASWIPKIVYNSTTLLFPSPPSGDPYGGQTHRPDVNTNISNTGVPQVQYNWTKKTYTVEFVFLSDTDKANIQAFFDWAKQGGSFDYYSSNELVATKETMYLELPQDLTWEWMFTDGAGGAVWKTRLILWGSYQ